MDAKTRRQAIVLAALVALLAVAIWWNMTPSGDPEPTGRTRATPQARRAAGATPVEPIRLDALAAPKPEPVASRRDPFRFRPTSRVEMPPPPRPGDFPMPGVNEGFGNMPPVATGPPPIPLRFIGIVRLPQSGRLIAVLSDGSGVYRGGEGDVIEGRYRIVRLRPESVELAYVDGRGHQVIRLSGS